MARSVECPALPSRGGLPPSQPEQLSRFIPYLRESVPTLLTPFTIRPIENSAHIAIAPRRRKRLITALPLLLALALLLSPLAAAHAQSLTFLVDEQQKEYFLKAPHYFLRYDSTGILPVTYSNEDADQSDTMEIYFLSLEQHPQLARYETFAHFTRDNHLVSIPQLDPAELTYRIEFTDSFPDEVLPCSNATQPMKVMGYHYTARIFYQGLLLFEQNYSSSSHHAYWNQERETEVLQWRKLVFIDAENKKLYSLLDNLKVFALPEASVNKDRLR